MMQESLLIKNLSKSFYLKYGFRKYVKKNVLENISISVKQNSIFGLIGLNGIGKTTLIKCILNIINFEEGAISVFDIDRNDKDYKSNIAYLPEKFLPSQHLTGYDFLKISSLLSGETLDLEKVKKMCDRVDFNYKNLNMKISNMSKGMGQKIGLISVFISNKKLLILDEPMSGLDPKARIEIKRLILDSKKEGRTVFFTSHILNDVQELCDDMSVIHNGKILYLGDVASFTKEKQNIEQTFIDIIS